MKTIKPFAVLAVVLSLSSGVAQSRQPKAVAAASAQAASRAAVPVVTRDNFVSLSMSVSGFDSVLQNILVRNSSIIRTRPNPATYGGGWGGGSSGGVGGGFPPPYTPDLEDVGPLSNNQFNALLRAINQARLPALAGHYEEKSLRDGATEILTLTISDHANRDRTFSIQNHGDTAPRAYYEFMARLRASIAMKFPEPVAPAQPQPAPQ